MRQRRKKWSFDVLAENKRMIHNPETFKGKWKDYFNNDNEIHLEIGCGKGKFISENAMINKNINYIALERERNVICMAVRYADDTIQNLGFILGDVENLSNYFDDNELNRIYINFCDPWGRKKKWAKRRLTHVRFLEVYKSLLKPNGEIHFKTDNKGLFEFSLNEFLNQKFELKNITLDLLNSGFEENITTEYEEKFMEKGMEIYRLEATNKK